MPKKLLWFLLLPTLFVSGSGGVRGEHDPYTQDGDLISANTNETNKPGPFPPDIFGGFESDAEDREDEDNHMNWTKYASNKEQIDKAMKGNNTTGKLARIKRTTKAVAKFVHKHEVSITVLALLFTFRKEIKGCVRFFYTVNPVTGEIVQPRFRVTPMNALKLLLLLNLSRKAIKSGASSSGGGDQSGDGSMSLPLALTLLLLSQHLGIFGVLVLPALLSSSQKSSIFLPPVEQHYTFESINSRYTKDGMALQRALDAPATGKRSKSMLHEALDKVTAQKETQHNGTTILLDMTKLDTSVSQIGAIRDKVSFILSEYTKLESKTSDHGSASSSTGGGIEVAVLLQSPGGSAPDYALAAQQLIRLRNHPNITVTVLVDKVAASGGYMIACTSSPGRLFAAPFAVLGSIGVIGQTVNIQKTLESWGVQPLVFRGGRDKAPLGLLGEVSEEGVAKVQEMVDTTHDAFKRHVAEARPVVADTIDEVATGETWLGYDAINVGLVDRIITSDEYISQRIEQGALVLKLLQLKKPSSTLFRPATEDMTSSFSTLAVGAARVLSTIFGGASKLMQQAQLWAEGPVRMS